MSSKNILEEMSKSDIVFMTKKWNPVIAYQNGINLTLSNLRRFVHESPKVLEIIQKLSADYGVPRTELQTLVKSYLEDMGHFRSMTMIRWIGWALCHILKKNYSGIIVNEESVNNVKSMMGSNPVLFLPSHKSYADFILMSFLCFYYNIEIPVIAAGEDFQSMWVMGRVLRECCAFFIRRSFGDDDLYKTIVSEYVNTLITLGRSAMEFFVEGTRSRTGKSREPKYGMMTMALEPYFEGKVPDITIVPVSITYERALEENLFAREMLGLPKPKESTRLLLKALQVLKDNYGRVFVEFAPPMSVKDFCQYGSGRDPRMELNLASRFNHPHYPTAEISQLVESICYSVIRVQNKYFTFSAIHMLCASMSVWSSYENKVPLQRIMKDMKYLQDILQELEALTVMKDSVEEEIIQCVTLHQRTMYFDRQEGSVKLHLGLSSGSSNDPIWQIQSLSENTLSDVYPAMIIQQYANPVCLRCIHVSIVTLLLCTALSDKEEIIREKLLSEYTFLRQMLAVEFVLQDLPEPSSCDFNEAVNHLTALNILVVTTNGMKLNRDENNIIPNRDRVALLLGLIHPFLRGYFLALDVCIQRAEQDTWIPEKNLKLAIQKGMESHINRGVPRYILSTDLITNALVTFIKVGIIKKKLEGDAGMLSPLIDQCRSYQKSIEKTFEGIENFCNEVQDTFSTLYKKTGSKL